MAVGLCLLVLPASMRLLLPAVVVAALVTTTPVGPAAVVALVGCALSRTRQ